MKIFTIKVKCRYLTQQMHIIFGKRDCEGQNYRGLAHLALQVRRRARRNFAPPFSGRKSWLESTFFLPLSLVNFKKKNCEARNNEVCLLIRRGTPLWSLISVCWSVCYDLPKGRGKLQFHAPIGAVVFKSKARHFRETFVCPFWSFVVMLIIHILISKLCTYIDVCIRHTWKKFP